LLNEIAKFALLCPQIICIGDFHQFGAVADTFCGSPVTVSLEESDLLLQLCGGRRLTLTENHRSDPELFAFYSRIPRALGQNMTEIEDLQSLLVAAREQFPLKNWIPRYSLCISHATRVQVNRRYNVFEARAHPEAVYVRAPASKEDNQPQSFHCWARQELIGAGGKCKKGVFYTVVAVGERLVLEGNGESVSLPIETAAKSVRLSHALTYASCQGLSLCGVRLLDTTNPHFGWKHLYVGVSRCTSSALLEVS